MKEFIHSMYKNKLLIKDGIIYDTTDGCIKQYRFANTIWLLSVLEFTYIVLIYRCIDDPGSRKKQNI